MRFCMMDEELFTADQSLLEGVVTLSQNSRIKYWLAD